MGHLRTASPVETLAGGGRQEARSGEAQHPQLPSGNFKLFPGEHHSYDPRQLGTARVGEWRAGSRRGRTAAGGPAEFGLGLGSPPCDGEFGEEGGTEVN